MVIWHKGHTGVDAKSGLTSLLTMSANEHDFDQVCKLLHGAERFISGDAGYQGQKNASSQRMLQGIG